MIKLRNITLIAIVLLIAFGIIAYGNSLKNGFVYDDTIVIEGNSFITSWSNLRHIFDVNYFLGSGELSYRPLITITYLIDYSLWGTNPFGYHLTNLILHIICGLVVYFFLIRVIPYVDKHLLSYNENTIYILSLLASLFFISHPIHAEAVNPAAFRPEILYTIFLLLCFMFYFKGSFLISLIFYFVALFCKEAALIAIAIIFVMDVFFYLARRPDISLSNLFKNRIPFYVGYVVISAIYVLIRFFWMAAPVAGHKMVSLDAIFHSSLYSRLITAAYIFIRYLKLLIMPLSLTSEYAIDFSHSILQLPILASLFILIGMLILILYGLIKNFRLLSFSGLWLFISLIPASNLVPLHHPMAERYLYFPSIGFFLFLAAVLIMLSHFFQNIRLKFGNAVLWGMVGIILCLYPVKAIAQNRMWKDEKTFWNAVIDKPGPHTARAYANLGVVLMEEGKFDAAIHRYKQALKRSPSYIQAYNNIGLIYYQKGDYDKAIENYQKILDKKAYLADFDFIKVYSNLGIAYMDKGMPDKAIEHYQRALELNPYLAGIEFNLGQAYMNKQMPDEAAKHYNKALDINPNLVKPYYGLGMVFLEKGLYDEAIKYFTSSVRISEDFGPGYYGLSLCYYGLKDYNKAMEYIDKCKELGLSVPSAFLDDLKREVNADEKNS